MKNYYSTVNNIICSFSDIEENNGFEVITKWYHTVTATLKKKR